MNALFAMRDDTSCEGSPLQLWLKRHGAATVAKYKELQEAGGVGPICFEAETPSKAFHALIDPEDNFAQVDKFSQVRFTSERSADHVHLSVTVQLSVFTWPPVPLPHFAVPFPVLRSPTTTVPLPLFPPPLFLCPHSPTTPIPPLYPYLHPLPCPQSPVRLSHRSTRCSSFRTSRATSFCTTNSPTTKCG